MNKEDNRNPERTSISIHKDTLEGLMSLRTLKLNSYDKIIFHLIQKEKKNRLKEFEQVNIPNLKTK